MTVSLTWIVFLSGWLVASVGGFAHPSIMQATNGAICALVFNDANQNQTRDPSETMLDDVNVSLIVNSVVIANHLTHQDDGAYCFNNLTAGAYTLSFGAALADATTPATFNLTLGVGEQTSREFGAVPKGQKMQTANGGLVLYLTRPVRLGLAIAGALLVMLFTTGIGLILRGLYGIVRRR